MILKTFYVRDFMRLSPIYVYETDSLFHAYEYMKKFELDYISVINKNFSIIGKLSLEKIKETIKGSICLNLNRLKSLKVKDIFEKKDLPVLFYPKMKAKDAFYFMKCVKDKLVPVVDNPWEKKVLGFLWIKDAASEQELKLPVQLNPVSSC